MTRRFPRASFKVATANPSALYQRELQQRNVNLVVMPIEGMTLTDDVKVESLFDDRQVIMASASSKWARRRTVPLEELAKERWFAPPSDSPVGMYVADCFLRVGVRSVARPEPKELLTAFDTLRRIDAQLD